MRFDLTSKRMSPNGSSTTEQYGAPRSKYDGAFSFGDLNVGHSKPNQSGALHPDDDLPAPQVDQGASRQFDKCDAIR